MSCHRNVKPHAATLAQKVKASVRKPDEAHAFDWNQQLWRMRAARVASAIMLRLLRLGRQLLPGDPVLSRHFRYSAGHACERPARSLAVHRARHIHQYAAVLLPVAAKPLPAAEQIRNLPFQTTQIVPGAQFFCGLEYSNPDEAEQANFARATFQNRCTGLPRHHVARLPQWHDAGGSFALGLYTRGNLASFGNQLLCLKFAQAKMKYFHTRNQ